MLSRFIHILIPCLLRDGQCGGWLPLTFPQLLNAFLRGSSCRLPKSWLCFTWAQKLAFGKDLFPGSCFSSVSQRCLTLCNPMDCSKSGFPVLHYLPEFPQIHVHWVSDAIQPFHPLLGRAKSRKHFISHGKDWEMSVSLCSLCTESWGNLRSK